METITDENQVDNLTDNKIIGSFKLINSKINFNGINNTLVCENNVKFSNAVLNFNGDNSLVYLCSDMGDALRLLIYNNSTLFIGKNTLIGASINLNVNECQNVIIGDECIICNGVKIFSSDYCPIYSSQTKSRKNFSKSIFIGDHVLLGRFSYISRGVKIGSGSIIGDNAVILPNTIISSNNLVYGNPARIVEKNVFFTREFVSSFKFDETVNSQHYKSDVFIYGFSKNETLDSERINEILNELDVESRVEFVQKLFIKNKRKNRFSIS